MGIYIALLLMALLGWFWLDSLRARELASGISRQACERMGQQFLDDTVALRRLGLQRDRSGRLRILRTYSFEFTSTGATRSAGTIVMRGIELEQLIIGSDIVA